MKHGAASILGLVALAAPSALGDNNVDGTSPVLKVLKLLNELKARIEGDGKAEQQSYDKNACWCEDTLARKAKDISNAKVQIEELSTLIVKLSGDTATHKAEMAQLEKDIAENKNSQKEATGAREKSHAEYQAVKTEAEQSLGALEAAVGAIAGAGEGKKTGFLSTSMQEANLLSVAAGVRSVLALAPASQALSDEDLQVVNRFVQQPSAFAHRTLSAVQVGGQNPFGDYAPAGGQISGVLKGLYDAFAQNLEKANAEEAEAEKAYRELMATKKQEQETLEASLEKHTSDFAEKDKTLAESQQLRDDTEAQLKADEVFFKDTKASCQSRAKDWAERSRLRTEELQGVATALNILGSPEAKATFESAATTFLQEGSLQTVAVHRASIGDSVSKKLRVLAARHPSTAASLSELAVEAATAGHFDKVIGGIDKMIAELRKEEQEDIAHRDRCQGDSNKNANDMEDLQHAIDKAGDAIAGMEDKASNLRDDIDALEAEIENTNSEMEEALKMRNKANEEFKQALLDDTNGVALLEAAIAALGKFYKKNKIPMFLQQPEYSVDKDKMPEAAKPAYGGRKGDSAPIIGMISQIKEDLEMEIKTGRQEEADAQAAYKKENAAMAATLKAQTDTKVATEKDLSELEAKIADKTAFKEERETDLKEQGDLKGSINTDCAWVATHFDTRREARKNEINGLVEAKNFLAGGGDGI